MILQFEQGENVKTGMQCYEKRDLTADKHEGLCGGMLMCRCVRKCMCVWKANLSTHASALYNR